MIAPEARDHSTNRADMRSAGNVVQAQYIEGDVNLYAPPTDMTTIPKQLPGVTAHFTGRKVELAQLDGMANTVSMIVFTGPAGVGKTALALTWLHSTRSRYPDGQLFGDLQAASGGGVTTDQLLGTFLSSLGVPARAQPTGAVERAALFRSLTTDRRILIMLDNISKPSDVLPLLPGPPWALVVATTRHRLPGLVARGARKFDVGPLPDESARELALEVLGGHGITTTPEEIEPLVQACGGLPLALRLALAQLACKRWNGPNSVARLLRRAGSLDAFEADEFSVRAALDSSYDWLAPLEARAFRLLSEHPGPDFTRAVVASAIGTDLAPAERVLQALVDLHLVEELAPDRYRMHDLVRHYAREKAAAVDGEIRISTAVVRMSEWYLSAALIADRTVMPTRRRMDDVHPDAPGLPTFATAEEALDWAENHLPHQLAVVHRHAREALCYRMVDAMWSLFLYRKHYPDWLESHEIGVRAAQEGRDVLGETLLLNHFGLGLHGAGRYSEALEKFARALKLHREAGDRIGEATALNSIGLAFHALGQRAEAAEHFEQALALQIALGQRRGEALTRLNLARTDTEIGKVLSAKTHLTASRAAFESQGDHYNLARVEVEMSKVFIHCGQLTEAERLLEKALVVMSTLRVDKELANVHDLLSGLARDPAVAKLHRSAAARHRWRVTAPDATTSAGDQVRYHEPRQASGHVGFRNADERVNLTAQERGELPRS